MKKILVLSLLISCLIYQASATCLVLSPISDTYLHSEFPDSNFGSYGVLEIGRQLFTLNKFRLLAEFSLSAVTATSIDSAVVIFTMEDPHHYAGTINVNETSTGWVESAVTWNTSPANLGYVGTATLANGYVTVDVTDLVNAKLSSSINSFSLELSSTNLQVQVRSKENQFLQSKLRIGY